MILGDFRLILVFEGNNLTKSLLKSPIMPGTSHSKKKRTGGLFLPRFVPETKVFQIVETSNRFFVLITLQFQNLSDRPVRPNLHSGDLCRACVGGRSGALVPRVDISGSPSKCTRKVHPLDPWAILGQCIGAAPWAATAADMWTGSAI